MSVNSELLTLLCSSKCQKGNYFHIALAAEFVHL